MSTARDPSYDEEFSDDVDQPGIGTGRRSEPAGYRGAAGERLVAPTAMASAATPQAPAATPQYGGVLPVEVDRRDVLVREQERFGGIKIGSAFLGWMAAVGVGVLLTALLTAAGVVLSLTSSTTTTDISNQASAATGTAKTIGLIGAILLLLAMFAAYYCGGYVAGRMARFNGTKQGLAVWLWGIVFAVVIALLVEVAGSRYNILSNLNLPHIPISQGDVTTAGIIAIVAAVVVTLGGALLGGRAGMHFHREVDKAGLGL